MNTDGSNLRQLTEFQNIYNVIAVYHDRCGQPDFSIAPDSQSLVYLMGYPLQVVQMSLHPQGWTQRTALAESKEFGDIAERGLCCLSPDGHRVYVTGTYTDGLALYELNIESRDKKPVLFNVEQPLLVHMQS